MLVEICVFVGGGGVQAYVSFFVDTMARQVKTYTHGSNGLGGWWRPGPQRQDVHNSSKARREGVREDTGREGEGGRKEGIQHTEAG